MWCTTDEVGKEMKRLKPIIMEEGENQVKIRIEEIAKLHAEMHGDEPMDGKPCVCVASGFRATQLALSNMWHEDKEIPVREDIKIISTLPTKGSQLTFKYMLGIELEPWQEGTIGDYVLEPPEGTDAKHLTTGNYVFTFIRKSTNTSYKVQVIPELFSDGYFELGTIVEHEIPREPTEEEREKYEGWEMEVREKLLSLPEDEIFIGTLVALPLITPA